jgi:hypothetical protein
MDNHPKQHLGVHQNRWVLVLVLAVVIAIAGFLLIDDYLPSNGISWNVMNGKSTVWNTHNCEGYPSWWKGPCDDPVQVDYKWIAVLCIALAGYGIFLRATKTQKQTE